MRQKIPNTFDQHHIVMDSLLMNIRWDYYMEGKSIITKMNPMVAYQKGLSTWARWVDLNLNPRKTRVIFRSMSPRHNRYNIIFQKIWIQDFY